MARSTADPNARVQATQLPGEPVDPRNTPTTIDQAAAAGFPAASTGPGIVHAGHGGDPIDPEPDYTGSRGRINAVDAPSPVARRLEAYRSRERKTTQLARTLGRVFTNAELAQVFAAIPPLSDPAVQLLADAVGKAWGDTRADAVAARPVTADE